MLSRGNATSGEPICSGIDRVAEAEEQRRREQQQHDRAVHREQLVVVLVVHELLPGRASSARITSAISPANRNHANEVTR